MSLLSSISDYASNVKSDVSDMVNRNLSPAQFSSAPSPEPIQEHGIAGGGGFFGSSPSMPSMGGSSLLM